MALKIHRIFRQRIGQRSQLGQTFLSWDLQDFLAAIAEFSSEVRA